MKPNALLDEMNVFLKSNVLLYEEKTLILRILMNVRSTWCLWLMYEPISNAVGGFQGLGMM